MIAALLLSFVTMLPVPAPMPVQAPRPEPASAVTGTVRDADGAAVPGASVVAKSSSGSEQRTITGPDGTFTITLAPPFDLTVRAGGFSEKRQTVSSPSAGLTVVLELASHAEQVLVTAGRTEQRIADVPASVSVLNKEDIRQSPGVTSDEVLKQLPQFALFRQIGRAHV